MPRTLILDRAKETTVTQGDTQPYELDGAVAGFRSFVTAAKEITGDSTGPWEVRYLVSDVAGGGADSEWGVATLTEGTLDTLDPTTVEGSSNGGARVNWGAGTRDAVGVLTATAYENVPTLGNDGIEDHTVDQNGAIFPTQSVLRIDTAGAAPTDDLESMEISNHPIGRLVLVFPVNNDRTIVLKHLANGGLAGDIDLTNFGGLDLELNNTTMHALVQRRGNVWILIDVLGREDVHIVGASGEPDFIFDWEAAPGSGAPRFWKDASGIVHLAGVVRKVAGQPEPSESQGTSDAIFELPEGYRPSVDLTFLAPADPDPDNFATVGIAFVSIIGTSVRWNGDMNAVVTADNNGQLGLNGITFRAEQ